MLREAADLVANSATLTLGGVGNRSRLGRAWAKGRSKIRKEEKEKENSNIQSTTYSPGGNARLGFTMKQLCTEEMCAWSHYPTRQNLRYLALPAVRGRGLTLNDMSTSSSPPPCDGPPCERKLASRSSRSNTTAPGSSTTSPSFTHNDKKSPRATFFDLGLPPCFASGLFAGLKIGQIQAFDK